MVVWSILHNTWPIPVEKEADGQQSLHFKVILSGILPLNVKISVGILPIYEFERISLFFKVPQC